MSSMWLSSASTIDISHLVVSTSYQLNETLSNNSTNSTICHPILFQLGNFSRESTPQELYGLCPDALTTPIFSSILLFLIILMSMASILGIIAYRHSGHIKARGATTISLSVCVHLVFVSIFFLRLMIDRKTFPCAIYTLLYFLLPAAVTLPMILRCIRLYSMYKLNLIKTRIFDVDGVDSVNGGGGRKKTNEMVKKEEIVSSVVEIVEESNHVEMKNFENRQHSVHFEKVLSESTINQETPSSLNTTSITHNSSSNVDSLNNSGIDETLKQQENNLQILSEVKGTQSTFDVNENIHTNDESTVTDDEDITNTFTLNTSRSTWNLSDINSKEVQSQARKLNILTFISSYKFMVICYACLLILQFLLWLGLGGIEEIIFTVSPPADNSRIFLLEGGMLLFSHGCSISTKFVIIFGVITVIYFIIEIGAFILCLFADRDTWNIKKETVILLIFQVICLLLFVITGNIDIIVILTDYFIPYGYTLMIYSYIEILIYSLIPIMRSMYENYKKKRQVKFMQQEASELSKSTSSYHLKPVPLSDVERVLMNKRTFNIVLDFGRRSYCVESVLAWRDIQRYQKSRRHRKKIAQHIISTYLTIGSPFELNISNIEKKRLEYSTIIEESKKLESSLFDSLESHCLSDMTDLFDRLRSSNAEIDTLVKSFKN
ncbi:predicted protein [Naegleria gruberi]|uniref:Predicted protein n=1 Tax=Naegleria gruberi TaxID=5762 RepID=D2W2I8_NAEGR|nr:uncharacterized protein NAEGRDRAFT_75602 [Naegleria gruberi]EFC36720.1 predicted protein [Naegleria gruberi]|eukprot:XP_002669464.1 predicted protein [Naegleria gruberi strain NEG-M]